MATYNGEKYISEQINSILKQTYQNWILYIHDDGSSDNTLSIIKYFSQKYPSKIIFIEDGIKKLGAKNNFFHLIKYSKSKYLMFCDQDDFWLEDKIFLTFKKIKENEELDINTPIVVYTDLSVVNKNLDIIHRSFNKQKRITHPSSLEDILARNSITGCTLMFNRSLVNLLFFPRESIMHDWWIGIETLRNNGKIIYLDKPTILYRQHENNHIGVTNRKLFIKIFLFPFLFYRYYRQFKISSDKNSFLFFIKFISSRL